MPRLTNNASLENGARGSEVRVPTAYSIDGIYLTDHTGQNEYDIQALVTDFSITESIYRPALSISLNVKDVVNFMSQARISGHEKIRIKLSRKEYSDGSGTAAEKRVELTFLATEYPVYGKSNNLVQAYTIRGVTPHGYLTKLKKISRAFNGKITDIVKTIAIQDLGIPESQLVISEKSTGQISGIFPNMEPLDAIHWLLRRAYAEDGSPFYFYQALDGKVYLQSQSDLVQKSSYREYIEGKFFINDPAGDKSYEEMAKRIISLNSELNLAKPYQANRGAYASRSVYVDISQKQISRVDFKYLDEFQRMPTVEGYSMLSDKFLPESTENLSKYVDSRINYVPVNALNFGGSNYNSTTVDGMINKANSYLETLDSIQHEVMLAGDFELNCGKVVELRLPPPIDPEVKKTGYTVNDESPTRDPFLSGGYLVTAAQHNFAEDYFVEIRVKRDSTYENMFE